MFFSFFCCFILRISQILCNNSFHLYITTYKHTANGVFDFSLGWSIFHFNAGWSVHVTLINFSPRRNFNSGWILTRLHVTVPLVVLLDKVFISDIYQRQNQGVTWEAMQPSPPHFFATTCIFAILFKNYKLCYSNLNWLFIRYH